MEDQRGVDRSACVRLKAAELACVAQGYREFAVLEMGAARVHLNQGGKSAAKPASLEADGLEFLGQESYSSLPDRQSCRLVVVDCIHLAIRWSKRVGNLARKAGLPGFVQA